MITSKQSQAIEYLSSGKRISEVSELIGVSRRAIYNWMKRSEFNELLEASKQDAIKRLSLKLISLNEEVLEVAQECLHSRSEAIRLRAVSILIGRFYEAVEVLMLHDEIDRINKRLDQLFLKQ